MKYKSVRKYTFTSHLCLTHSIKKNKIAYFHNFHSLTVPLFSWHPLFSSLETGSSIQMPFKVRICRDLSQNCASCVNNVLDFPIFYRFRGKVYFIRGILYVCFTSVYHLTGNVIIDKITIPIS